MPLNRNRAQNQPTPLMFGALVAGLFFYIFPVVFLPVGLPLALVAYFIFGALWATRPITVPIGALPIHVAGVLLLVAAYAGMVTMLRGTNDLTFAVQIAKVAILYLGSGVVIGVICINLGGHDKFHILIRAFVYCCLIQALFIALGIFSIQFRIIMDGLIAATGNTNYLISFRVRGFSASGGAALGLNQAIGVLSALYLFLSTRKSYFFWIAVAIWITTFFVARTGFFLGAFFFFVYFLSVARIFHFLRTIFLRPVGLFGVVAIVGSFAIILPNIEQFFEPEALERVEKAFRWGFELFLSAQSGSAETATTNALLDMLVIPHEPSYFIFGFGVFDSGAFGYERTDSGYLKTWYSSGVVGVIVVYGTLFSAMLFTALRYNRPDFTTYMLLVIGVIAVVEIKEPFLYQNYFGRYAFILIGAGSVINWNERRLRKTRRIAANRQSAIGVST